MKDRFVWVLMFAVSVGLSGCQLFHHVTCMPKSMALACANAGPDSQQCRDVRTWVAAHPEAE
jgi:hypothetical protein